MKIGSKNAAGAGVKRVVSFERKKQWYGIAFSAPFIIGFILMYMVPLVSSVNYAFSDVTTNENGVSTTFNGFANFSYAFTQDPNFISTLFSSLGSTLYQTILILLFSLFIAMMLNDKFRGRIVVRAIFFIPVIVASGMVIHIMTGDVLQALQQGGQNSSSLLESTFLKHMLSTYGIGDSTITAIVTTIDSIFQLAWRSGIQILIFLAALQSISKSLYESSAIEGANAWENFWFITMPMIMPILLVNTVYTIIDNFTDYNSNKLMAYINDNYLTQVKYGCALAMAWTYFLIIAVLLAIVYLIITKLNKV